LANGSIDGIGSIRLSCESYAYRYFTAATDEAENQNEYQREGNAEENGRGTSKNSPKTSLGNGQHGPELTVV
jgi:hypothetical protein